MPYAIKDMLSQSPIDGGIEITEAQYVEARDKMPLGWQVDVRDGELFLLSPVKRKVYSTVDGSEKEIPENETTPDDYTELERPDSYHEWNGTAWVLADGALEKLIDAALSYERDKALDVDVDIALSGSRTIVLKNNERTKINISFKLSTLSADTSIESLAYECRNGWFDLSHGDYQEAILSLDMFTQSIFDKLRPVYEANHTSVEDAVNDFKARLEDV